MDVVKSLIVVAFTSGLAWIVGSRITFTWDDLRRSREADLEARSEFYRVYGEFFSTWKLWNTYSGTSYTVATPEHAHWELLCRAEDAEAGFESLLVKLASERRLDEQQLRLLACFRQGYQSLRKHIRAGKPLRWWASSESRPEAGYRDYEAFKALAEFVATLLAEPHPRSSIGTQPKPPTASQAARALLEATAFVPAWVEVAREGLELD